MDIKMIMKMFEVFSNNYGTKQPTKEMVLLYEGYLKDIPDEKVPQIMQSIIATESFYPNIAVIRKHFANLGMEKMTEVELLEKTNYYIGKFGRYQRPEMMAAIKENESETFLKVIQAVGVSNLLDCDMNFKSTQLARMYKEVKEKEKENVQLLENKNNKMIGE